MTILGTFILVVILHASWDIISGINGLPIAVVVLGYLVIAAVGLTLAINRIRKTGGGKGSSQIQE